MGDRISISFKNGNWESPVLFSHWGGAGFYEEAKRYLENLKEETKNRPYNPLERPLERMEPGTVMVDFVRHLTSGEDRIMSDLYLEVDQKHGDNSDNGHFTLDLQEYSNE